MNCGPTEFDGEVVVLGGPIPGEMRLEERLSDRKTLSSEALVNALQHQDKKAFFRDENLSGQ